MKREAECAEKLFQLIGEGTSPYHVVQSAAARLADAGFQELDFADDWELNCGEKYFLKYHGSSLFAFSVGDYFHKMDSVRITAAHTDFPGLRIKTAPDISKEGYRQLNVEVYGGAILNTWLDRPLSVAGRVAIASSEPFYPEIRLFDAKKPLFTIPNLAIHLDRDINKGVELNKQRDLIPLAGLIGEDADRSFMAYLAAQLGVREEDILDFELGLYNADTGEVLGMGDEFLSAPRLDDLTSVEAILEALTTGARTSGINMAALFDHEEVGSRSKQGAGSAMLSLVLQKIFISLGYEYADYLKAVPETMLLSVDVGHAVHPNRADKSDPTAKAVLGRGFCIKENSGQSYATDCEAISIVQQICNAEDISYQKISNRSDIAGGTTLGPIASTLLPVKTVDIGVPLLAMHSARETMGIGDLVSLTDLIRAFYSL